MIFSPDLAATNSLFINNPNGWVYSRPFGAVRSIERLDIVKEILEKYLEVRTVFGLRSFRGGRLRNRGEQKHISMELNTGQNSTCSALS